MIRSAVIIPGVAALCLTWSTADATAPENILKSPTEFSGITDPAARSSAMFVEIGRVLQHPRCLNCHPSERAPTQGNDLHRHVPPIPVGYGAGVAALQCSSCHQGDTVQTYAPSVRSVPGHPHWSLAPASMAWQGQALAEICAQIKDPARNGGRTLAQIQEHLSSDTLVGWAWQPGDGRAPVPGTQALFGKLVSAWITAGAECPHK